MGRPGVRPTPRSLKARGAPRCDPLRRYQVTWATPSSLPGDHWTRSSSRRRGWCGVRLPRALSPSGVAEARRSLRRAETAASIGAARWRESRRPRADWFVTGARARAVGARASSSSRSLTGSAMWSASTRRHSDFDYYTGIIFRAMAPISDGRLRRAGDTTGCSVRFGWPPPPGSLCSSTSCGEMLARGRPPAPPRPRTPPSRGRVPGRDRCDSGRCGSSACVLSSIPEETVLRRGHGGTPRGGQPDPLPPPRSRHGRRRAGVQTCRRQVPPDRAEAGMKKERVAIAPRQACCRRAELLGRPARSPRRRAGPAAAGRRPSGGVMVPAYVDPRRRPRDRGQGLLWESPRHYSWWIWDSAAAGWCWRPAGEACRA